VIYIYLNFKIILAFRKKDSVSYSSQNYKNYFTYLNIYYIIFSYFLDISMYRYNSVITFKILRD